MKIHQIQTKTTTTTETIETTIGALSSDNTILAAVQLLTYRNYCIQRKYGVPAPELKAMGFTNGDLYEEMYQTAIGN